MTKKKQAAGWIPAPPEIIGRELEWKLLQLAYVSDSAVTFISEPGTAKTTLARSFAATVGKPYFGLQISPFTLPDSLYGLINPKEAHDSGRRVVNTTGMMPEAEVVLLDEVYKAGRAIRDDLLTYVLDRVYKNDNKTQKGRTRMFIFASNELPDGADATSNHAFWDRSMLRHFMRPLGMKERRIMRELQRERRRSGGRFTINQTTDLDVARDVRQDVEIPDDVSDTFDLIISSLESSGVHVTDRHYESSEVIVQSAAAIEGRDTATGDDLRWMEFCCWNRREEISKVREIVRGTVNPTLARIERILNAMLMKSEAVKTATFANDSEKLSAYGNVNAELKRAIQEVESMAGCDSDRKDAVRALSSIKKDFATYITDKVL